MFRVAVLDDYQQVALEMADWKLLEPEGEVQAFADNLVDVPRLAERLHTFDAVVLMRERTPFPRVLLDRLPNLRLIVTAGMRNAAIDVAAATEKGVLVAGTDMLAYPTAELTWGLIIGLLRHIPFEAGEMRKGAWQTTLGRGLHGKTLGVLGLGRLGAQVAAVGKAFGMDLIAWSQNLTAERATAAGARLVSKEGLFAQADLVTIHVVLSDRTRGLVGAPELGRMKPTAYLVNTSRGPIVEANALLETLRACRIAGAALDVFDREPLPADDPLRRLDNVVLTPHLGYVLEENHRLVYPQAVEAIRALMAGKPVPRAINEVG
ncbi:MAG TPA: D-2-hydroxyacid dehydrogenase family protein [Stellaceae bacterium]|jgi:phosphoglycerate dehydrogenase-like enzyme|nr:D-2-hydroxyacid dehydrogenase family protein [Stellaceae bacterium]